MPTLLHLNPQALLLVAVSAFCIGFTKPGFSGLGLITPSSLVINLIMLPAIVEGMLGGGLLLGKVSQGAFEWVAIVMAIASAARMTLV